MDLHRGDDVLVGQRGAALAQADQSTAGQGANVYPASAELAAIAAVMGRLPTADEYLGYAEKIDSMAPEIYRYLNFDHMPEFVESAERGRSVAVDFAA